MAQEALLTGAAMSGCTVSRGPHPGGPKTKLALARVGHDVTVSPWPFSVASLELQIPVTRIPGRAYADAEEFHSAYAAGQSEVLTCRVIPASS